MMAQQLNYVLENEEIQSCFSVKEVVHYQQET